jgi:hypothetical protein
MGITHHTDLKKQSDCYSHVTFKGTRDIGVFRVSIDGVEVRGITAATIETDNGIGRAVTLKLNVPLRNLHFE